MRPAALDSNVIGWATGSQQWSNNQKTSKAAQGYGDITDFTGAFRAYRGISRPVFLLTTSSIIAEVGG